MQGERGGTSRELDDTQEFRCVVVTVAKASSNGDTSVIYARKIDEDGAGEGQPFRLATRDFRYIWQNGEVDAAKIKFGSVVKYIQTRDQCVFQGNTRRRRDVDKIQMDLSYDDGGAFRGIRDAFPDAKIDSKGIRQDHRSMQSLRLISLKYGKIKNERILLKTKLGEHVNLKLNCRENLVLSTSPVVLQVRHGLDVEDVGDVALVKMGDSECSLGWPTFQAVCEGLILKHKPKAISPDEEPVEIMDDDGNFILVPGNVKFDSGNDGGTAISKELVDALSLEPDDSKKKKVSIPGLGSLQCSNVAISIKIRNCKFRGYALVGAVAAGTDLLIGMDIMRKLGDKGYSLSLS